MSHSHHDHDHDHDHAHDPGPVADASVRVARPNDAAAVGFVQATLWQQAYAGVLSDDVRTAMRPEEFARVWRQSLENPPSQAYRLLVACAGEQVVGFAAVGPSGDPDATEIDGELLVGGVHSEARRVGHGSRLLNAAVDTAAGAGFARIRTWLLTADTPTQHFLTDAGFALDGARRDRAVGPSDADVAAELRLTVDVPT